jgi:hypothetical protein
VGLVEVLALGDADERAGRVVDPAVVRAREAAGAAPRRRSDERRAAVLADVVEGGERPVGLAGDDDDLAVALERHPVAGVLGLLAAAGEDPAAPEDALALQLEAHRIGVHVTAHRARAVVGDLLDPWAEAHRDVAARRDVDHVEPPGLLDG